MNDSGAISSQAINAAIERTATSAPYKGPNRNPIQTVSRIGTLIIGNKIDHYARNPSALASPTTTSVIVSSQSDSVLCNLLLRFGFDVVDTTDAFLVVRLSFG